MSKKIEKPEQTIRLSETSNMLRRLATAEIDAFGVYYCIVDGKKTKVIR